MTLLWKDLEPAVFRRGWDAAAAGEPRSANPFTGTGPRAAWDAGYDDLLRERAKDAALTEGRDGAG